MPFRVHLWYAVNVGKNYLFRKKEFLINTQLD